MSIIRCQWCEGIDIYERYHDEEWGVPVYDDKIFFEFLILEGAQAGLSWLTVLRKREGYRAAFADFDYRQVARFDEAKMEALMQDAGIVRNRLKIRSAVINAQKFIEVQEEYGSFSDYIWSFVDHQPVNNAFSSMSEVPAKTPLSDRISKDLAKRGFKFVGSTIIYAFLQATGLVNDHFTYCHRYAASV